MSTGEVYHSSYATLPDGKNDSRLSTEELIKGVPAGTGILIVAHPGHELRMHGWLQAVHPTTCVLTDGSGHSGQSRLASTSKVLEDVDAKIGALYGRLTDMQLYEAVLDLDHRLFIELASELSDALITEQVDYVVGDRAEGYNPGHDVCRLLIDAAIEAARQRHHKEIANFDFT
ncbi:MAG TPA: hypothetical protein VEF04_18280, partial [Blastocatellia bacterium]|nr:hypothetical protein [Blastocatellia bacterium]